MTNDSRIDDYIEKAQPFARPILTHLRKLVHAASPDITETIKWGAPFFEYKGIIGGMAAFKQHCAFSLMKAKLMKDADQFTTNNSASMGQLGKLSSVTDLPPDDVFIRYIQEAVRLNEENIKVAKVKATSPKELVYPEQMTSALKTNVKAAEVFAGMNYSNRKEYVEWICEAKTDATRNKRLATMLEWLEEGKVRNWKYTKC